MRNFFSVFLFYIRQICFIFKGRLYNSIESLKLSVKYLQGYLHVSFLSPRSFLYVVVFQLVAKQSFCCGFPFGWKAEHFNKTNVNQIEIVSRGDPILVKYLS